jgi:hypothetical protein
MHQGPIEPSLHIFSMRLAFRLAGIVEPCLRPEELHALITEYYQAIVQDMQQFEQEKRKRA